ncbi:GNAT family N-acetyltransferase [Microbulbifer celer]|uniref:GNAT family N-acetyltransferase n=1 Tax=Microbulbifer celer TaxID=435905 RepID=A0ABW3U5L9_9GAMM|nr:GNAT family N-acetyltransferase [Microbulbifer celer]UFN56150.1 GNAT family N-acetyltransferase [Microbulbifer celer]
MYTIRTMSRADLDIAVEWAANEGWNPGRGDAESFYVTDPKGFMVGCLGDKPIACISAVKYPPDFGFLGFYIVAPEYRGRGYGLQLWQAAMARVQGGNIGLDGVVEQQANYRKSGFHLAWRNVRYRGAGPQSRVDSGSISGKLVTLSPLAGHTLTEIADYDRQLFPARREAFLKSWVAQPGAVALGAVTGGKLCGYAVMRPCREGYKVGPLFAESSSIAEKLLGGLTARLAPEMPFFLDIPEPNPAAKQLVAAHGMQKVFETARMYTGPVPDIPHHKVFGVTTFELG